MTTLEEIDFFVTILEEEGFSPLNSYFSPLNLKEKEEEDVDSKSKRFKQYFHGPTGLLFFYVIDHIHNYEEMIRMLVCLSEPK
ncbi:hypothetical protein J2Y03_004944 [Neobacillus niacini]|uniref:hypothetical protein n=1 Tax=Neobacillus niacini TaxID=86668 RepID=UPI00286022F2|nr:hypothetical protein [Neobacillus niacini]MDR7079886.1 hypothetical protein [Neobacillus niacini]